MRSALPRRAPAPASRKPAGPASMPVMPSNGGNGAGPRQAAGSGGAGLPHDPFLDPQSSDEDEAAGCRVPARLTTSTRALARTAAPKVQWPMRTLGGAAFVAVCP